MNAIMSEVGVAYKIPFNPKNNGKINKNGITKITCLAKTRITPFLGLPIEENKLADNN